MRLSLYIPILLLLFNACKQDSNKSNSKTEIEPSIQSDSINALAKYYNDVFKEHENATFRAVNFDESHDHVKAQESKLGLELSDESDGYLQYEKDIHIDTANGIDYVMLKYIFDSNDRLWIITVNYIIQDSAKTSQLFDYFHSSFNDKYGDFYKDRDGFDVWEGSYKRNDSIDVVYDLGVRKLLKFDDPGIQIELMRFGQL